MTELEQLKADFATIKAASEIYRRDYRGCDYEAMIGIMQNRIAKLEAETDPWQCAKQTLDRIEMKERSRPDWQMELARYVRHLEDRVAELEAKK
jgi:hypothetical protein